MTFNPIRTFVGKIISDFFYHNENRAWLETESDKFDAVYSFGIGRQLFTQIEKNADYYSFLKTGYMTDYDAYYVESYKLFHLAVAKVHQFFRLQYTVKSYDPFNLIKSVAGFMLSCYFDCLKEKARRNPETYYYTISWCMDETWFHMLEEESYLKAEYKTRCNLYPRYYRFYFESYVFIELFKEEAFRFCRFVFMV